VFSGDTRPSHTLVDAGVGADLPIHETFPSTPVFAQKAGVHTSPTAVGKVLNRAGPQMSVMRHLAVDHDTVGPA
jgi:ribonuclease Z